MQEYPSKPGEVKVEGRSMLPLAEMPELELRTVLCAIDFSEESRKAFSYAVSLAKRFQAEVILVHVFEPMPPPAALLDALWVGRSLNDDLAKELARWRERISPEIQAKAVFREGAHPHEHIVGLAKEVQADLIIVGQCGRNALGRALVGSTAEKVVRSAPCPVLVVRQRDPGLVTERKQSASPTEI